MLEELLPDVFRITIPLPGHPLKTVNSYIITSKDRNLLVDTAWNRFDCAEVLLDAFTELGVDLSRTDVFLTHIHADHAGLIDLFTKHHAKIFCGQADIANINHFLNTGNDKSWPVLQALAAPHGFSTEEIAAGIEAHSGNRYNPSHPGNFFPIKNQDEIIIGNYTLACKATPGHTLGHTCLFDPARKLLFSGDHLLGQLFPTLSQWSLDGKCLTYYLSSLKDLADCAVDLVLPGHWEEFLHFRVRLAETLAFHHQRNAEILALLSDRNARTAYQIAAALSWNQKHGEWIFFPITRKWSAVADTIAHLCYLRDQGLLSMTMTEHAITWGVSTS